MNILETSKVYSVEDAIKYAEGSVISKIIIRKDTGNITLFSFDKDQFLSEHTAPFDAMVQVLDGKAEIVIGGKSYMLKPGEFIIMPANIPHVVKAVECFKMLLVMIKG